MEPRCSRLSAIVAVAVCVVAGCVSVPQGGVDGRAAEVKIYGSAVLYPSQYEVVRHLWGESWHAAFSLPTYPNETEAIAALQAEAARLGANGLIFVSCMDTGPSKWSWSREPAILCYADAIRVRSSVG